MDTTPWQWCPSILLFAIFIARVTKAYVGGWSSCFILFLSKAVSIVKVGKSEKSVIYKGFIQ